MWRIKNGTREVCKVKVGLYKPYRLKKELSFFIKLKSESYETETRSSNS